MSLSSSSVIGIILVIVSAGLVGTIFVGGVAGDVGEETNQRVSIGEKEDLMKLILYDSMIAYGCDEGGHLDDNGDKFWGDWATMKKYTQKADTINFTTINSSMPGVFEGLPCYGTGSTLPNTGSTATKIPGSPLSKEWRDDQEGIHSKIKFEINSTINDFPMCFVHHTRSKPTDVGGGFYPQYEQRNPDEVTNSWFLMSNQSETSVHDAAEGWASTSISCETINPAKPGTVDPNNPPLGEDNWDHGPAMNVEVLSGYIGADLTTGSPSTVSSSDFTSNIEITEYKFEEGTKGYVQTNIGCSGTNGPHSISDLPGISGEEIYDDVCDNKLHPFIVITKEG